MQSEQRSVKAIFDEAVDLEGPEARKAYLDRVCAGETELRGKLDALLVAYLEAGSFLQKPVVDEVLTGDLTSSVPALAPPPGRPVTEGVSAIERRRNARRVEVGPRRRERIRIDIAPEQRAERSEQCALDQFCARAHEGIPNDVVRLRAGDSSQCGGDRRV